MFLSDNIGKCFKTRTGTGGFVMEQSNVVGVVIYNLTLKCPDLPLEAMGLF